MNNIEQIIEKAKKSDALITFDFDNTLSKPHVQWYAKKLSNIGYSIGILTSRHDKPKYKVDGEYPSNHNQDLYNVANELEISPNNIIMTEGNSKHLVIEHMKAFIHLDDDGVEFDLINNDTDKKCVIVKPNDTDYRIEVDRLLDRLYGERILCSAIKVYDCGEKFDGVYLGLRHANCLLEMKHRRDILEADDMRVPMLRNSTQGFLTSLNRFVDRIDGMEIAKRHDQVINDVGNGKELYSENLY